MSFGGFPLSPAAYSPSPPRTRPANDRLSSLFRPLNAQGLGPTPIASGSAGGQDGVSFPGSRRGSSSAMSTHMANLRAGEVMGLIDTTGLDDTVLPVNRSRRRSSGTTTRSEGEDRRGFVSRPKDPTPVARRPRRASSHDLEGQIEESAGAGARLGLGITRITEHTDDDDDEENDQDGKYLEEDRNTVGSDRPCVREIPFSDTNTTANPNTNTKANASPDPLRMRSRREMDTFDEIRFERANEKGVDPSVLPAIHQSLSTLLSSHRLRIQTLQSTIQHKLQELEIVRYRMNSFDAEAEGLMRGIVGGVEDEEEQRAGGVVREEEDRSRGEIGSSNRSEEGEESLQTPPTTVSPGRSSPFGETPGATDRLDVQFRSPPHRPSPLSLSTRPASSSETIMHAGSVPVSPIDVTQRQVPAPPNFASGPIVPLSTLPPPLVALRSSLTKTSSHLTATEIELGHQAEKLAAVRNVIDRLPEVEAELIRRIERKRFEFDVIGARRKRTERHIMYAWILGTISLVVVVIAWLIRCEQPHAVAPGRV